MWKPNLFRVVIGLILLLTFTPQIEYNHSYWDTYPVGESTRLRQAGEVIYWEAVREVGPQKVVQYLTGRLSLLRGKDNVFYRARLEEAIKKAQNECQIQLGS